MTATTATRDTTTIHIPLGNGGKFEHFTEFELAVLDKSLAGEEKSWKVVSNTDTGHAKIHWSKSKDNTLDIGTVTLVGGKAIHAYKSGAMGTGKIRIWHKHIVDMRKAIKAELALRETA